MPFQRDKNLPELVSKPPCVFLRSKRLYVEGDFVRPELQEDERHYWCNLTQHVLGPDAQYVDRPSCIEGRPCFRLTR